MFGRILGRLISTPIRLVNVAVKVADDLTDPVRDQRLRDRDPLKLDEIADNIDRACDR